MKRICCLIVLAIAIMLAAQNSYAVQITYTADLTGTNEIPPNASPGTGIAVAIYDDVAHTLHVQATFSGLLWPTAAAHIHAPTSSPGTGTAPVATQTPTFTAFPLGVTSGTFDNILDMTLASSYNPAFVTAHGGSTATAEAALAAALAADEAYFNIHTTGFPGGEIRGFLHVPEPATLLLLGLGLVGLAGVRRGKK